MTSLQPLWWLALPVLVLPLWWHRQKRQRTATELLATARFLPSSAPQQRRIWRWSDVLLLIVRMLLLATLIAWLAVTIVPWRGDTVLLASGIDPAWVQREVTAARMTSATTVELPAGVLDWLQRHEHAWRTDARLLVLAKEGDVPMPAHPPAYDHAVTIRLASTPLHRDAKEHHVVLATPPEHRDRWRALFGAFATSGERYILADTPSARTELIVWDRADSPPPLWKAPHWWRPASQGGVVPAGGLQLAYADTPQGRVWSGMPWPPADAAQARALYDAWQAVATTAPPYPLAQGALLSRRAAALPLPGMTPAPWWGWLLLALFAAERLLTHARRS